jgi:aminopeptidase N
MRNPASNPTRLRDYLPPDFLIESTTLEFDLRADTTQVSARLACVRNPAAATPHAPLRLDGEALELLSVTLDGVALDPGRYEVTPEHLLIAAVPARFVLETVVRIRPESNTQLMGLYASQDGYFTQCEAEGFRRITYYADRPDVMARFTVTLRAARARFPVLLSNGNEVARGDEGLDRHWVRWEDPFPKPSYLFALVAARLELLEDTYTTASGRRARLCIYVEPGRLDQCRFAMEALKSAMRWDEQVFGLELDLDQYTIVAVSDFNMGAMENKGLNIFNTRYVLARADLATDYDFMMLDRVIAHEYFHNWTGNRVTCRDWFQLSLKEGLTVFRDQQYGGDRYSHAVQRIQEVRNLRNTQFAEDAGPMAHPVRPSSYVEISNFYTATVYNKGAEVVRLIHTLLGADGFRAGMDLYFARHDGQAVCTEDFVRAMQDATGTDLALIQRWYEQAGTPRLRVTSAYDPGRTEFVLHFVQSCMPGAGEPPQAPFPLPIRLGLLARDGRELPLETVEPLRGDDLFLMTETAQSLHCTGVTAPPVPSLLRGFSAPVILEYDYDDDELALLMARDRDPFNRWEAGQRLALRALLAGIAEARAGRPVAFAQAFLAACARVLEGGDTDPAFAAEALTLPAASFIAERMADDAGVVDPDAILAVRNALRRTLAESLHTALRTRYDELAAPAGFDPAPAAAARRALRNVCLGYLVELGTPELVSLCERQLATADNMTDASAALTALANADCPARLPALAAFHARWRAEPLVLDKWFAVQASSRLPGTLDEVRALLAHPSFDRGNPNRVRALIGSFCHGNHAGFHAADGAGYRFAAEQIALFDPLNPQIAARLARAFDRWRKFDAGRQAHARAALDDILGLPGLSRDTAEVVSRALA